jgi:hypothetical protein
MEEVRLVAFFLLVVVTVSRGVSASLTCPNGAHAFGSSVSMRHYYSCTNTEKKPVLMECPENLLYHTREQICVEPHLLAKPERQDMQALGRNFVLGSMYDERTQQFFPESSFWARQRILDGTDAFPTPKTETSFTADQSTFDRMEHMGIKAEIQMNFMSGGIQVGGSAGYLKDEVTSKTEVNVQMTYHIEQEEQSIDYHMDKDFPDECENSHLYTHAVTSITMGADAVFNFKRQTENGETMSDIEGTLSVSVTSIPNLDINGEGSVDISEEEKSVLEKTILRVHGDFSPEEALPSNFVQAVEFYKKLPQMFASVEDMAVINVHLTPITDICTGLDIILNQLNGDLMDNIIEMLDELQQVDMHVGELMALPATKLFKPLRENLNIFHVGLKTYTLGKKSQLQKWLPLSKNGTAGADDKLDEIWDEYINNSTYNILPATLYLDFRGREINAIQQLIDRFPPEDNIALADYESANDIQYVFERNMVTILEYNVVAPLDLTLNFMEDGTLVDDNQYWYNNIQWAGEFGTVLRHTHEFAMDNVGQADRGYLLKVSPFKQDQPYNSRALVMGQQISDHFEAPRMPALPSDLVDITHRSYSFNILKVSEFTIGCRVLLKQVASNITREVDLMFPEDAPVNQDVSVTVEHLFSARAYSFMVKYITAVGTSPPSLEHTTFNTAPTSAPYGLSVKDVSDTSMTLTWFAPEFYTPGYDESDISYSVKITAEDGNEEVQPAETTELTLSGLKDGTSYTFDVSAVIEGLVVDGMANPQETSVPATLTAYTAPLAPTWTSNEVDTHTALLTWDPPARLGSGAEVIHYEVNYMKADELRYIIVQDPQVRVMDLAQDTPYSFQVKVVSTKSVSAFSSSLDVRTQYLQNAMDALRDELYGAMNEVSTAIKQQTRFCASIKSTTTKGVLTYNQEVSNVNTIAGADMDMAKGEFTAGATGSYKVTVNMQLSINAGQNHQIWIMKNGQKVEETKINTSFGSNNGEWIDNASRDIIMFLAPGDKVSVTHEASGDEALENVSFCMSSLTFAE